MLTVLAPAKLNLTLEVLGKRPDGFHEVRSVIQAISLYDELSFEPGKELMFKSGSPEWNAEQSLVSKAASLVQKAAGSSGGAAIEVKKRIPLVSGLGGDSSDAAAVLCGLNRLWKLGLSRGELLKLAEQLGSDVPFFLFDGTALSEGRGGRITPLSPLPHMWVVLVVPHLPRLPGKTGQLYASLRASHYTDGRITDRLVIALKDGRGFVTSSLFNTFENVAFSRFSELDTYRKHLIKMGAEHVHLAGSGPTLYTLVSDRKQAEDLYLLCQNQNMQAYLAETL